MTILNVKMTLGCAQVRGQYVNSNGKLVVAHKVSPWLFDNKVPYFVGVACGKGLRIGGIPYRMAPDDPDAAYFGNINLRGGRLANGQRGKRVSVPPDTRFTAFLLKEETDSSPAQIKVLIHGEEDNAS